MTRAASLRERVAAGAVRVVNWASRTAGRGSGTVAGGRVGLALDPDLLGKLAQGRTVVVVSGTNGKTTTTALVTAGWGTVVATNETGANMPAGHVATLVGSDAAKVVLEVDEAWLPTVIAATRPQVVVLLNLSRDQLDRANEVRQMADRWRRCLDEPSNRDVIVVANANDPLVVYAASGSTVRWCDVPTPWLADARSCPRCTLPLLHDHGNWSCSCGFAKPSTTVVLRGHEIEVGDRRVGVDLSIPGDFNRGNAAMALAALAEVGVDLDGAVVRMNAVKSVAGRFTLRRWRSHTLRLLLAKNPAGFEALLGTVRPEDRDVWIAINAQIADGRDPSWLYDVEFERLRGKRVWCLGERRLDLATRLDYAEVEYVVVDDLDDLKSGDGPVELLANYTAFADWMLRTSLC